MADAALFHHRGRYLVALGHYYHPEEFTCCQCRKVLDEGGFFEEKGSIFCPKCYDTRYAPSCAKCKKKITGVSVPQPACTSHPCALLTRVSPALSLLVLPQGSPVPFSLLWGFPVVWGAPSWLIAVLFQEVMHALKMTWHVQCFTCAACKTPIRNRAFYMEEGQPYCERGRTRGGPTSPHAAPGYCPLVGPRVELLWSSPQDSGKGGDPREPSIPILPGAGWCHCWRVAMVMMDDLHQI